jgi:hypothetical protein
LFCSLFVSHFPFHSFITMVNFLSGAIALLSAVTLVAGEAVTFDIARKHSPSAKQAATAAKNRATALTKQTHAGNSLWAGHAPPTLSLQNAQYSYYMNITLGTPPQDFTMVLDTGSAVLWVADSACSPSVCVDALHYFDSSASSTYTRIANNTLEAYYGLGNATGYLGTDTLTFGNGAVKITKQEFGQATAQAYITDNGDDGIIGFGPDIATTWADELQTVIDTPLTNFVAQNPSYSKVFGIKFAPVPTGEVFAQNGLLTFGGLPDKSWYSGSLHWVPRAETYPLNYFWSVNVEKVEFGHVEIKQYNGTALSAIVDTGTTLILVDNSIFNPMYNSTKGSTIDADTGLWSVPCSSVKSLPNLSFVLNGKAFTLKPSQYMLPQWLVSLIIRAVDLTLGTVYLQLITGHYMGCYLI